MHYELTQFHYSANMVSYNSFKRESSESKVSESYCNIIELSVDYVETFSEKAHLLKSNLFDLRKFIIKNHR